MSYILTKSFLAVRSFKENKFSELTFICHSVWYFQAEETSFYIKTNKQTKTCLGKLMWLFLVTYGSSILLLTGEVSSLSLVK